MSAERRQNPRFAISFPCTVHLGGGGRILKGRAIDISRAGMFIMLPDPPAPNQRVEVMIETSTEAIFVGGLIVRTVPHLGLGVRFNTVSARPSGRVAKLLTTLVEPAP